MKRRLMMTFSACAATTLMVTGGVAASAAAATTSPALVHQIVYAAGPDPGIWVVNGDGTDNHQISPVTAYSVSFSPDGQRVAYGTLKGLWTISVNGGVARRVAHTAIEPADVAWSPNGKWIAFDAALGLDSGDRAIFRVAASGGTPTQLTFGAAVGCAEDSPAWSPDGSTIAYRERQANGPTCSHPGLAVQPIGGPENVIVPGYRVGQPSFTPTGNMVYLAVCNGCTRGYQGYESHIDGTFQTVVTPPIWECDVISPCWGHIIGAPRTHGWIAQSFQGEDGKSDLICFQGGYQKGGVVSLVAPSFCFNSGFAGFDAS